MNTSTPPPTACPPASWPRQDVAAWARRLYELRAQFYTLVPQLWRGEDGCLDLDLRECSAACDVFEVLEGDRMVWLDEQGQVTDQLCLTLPGNHQYGDLALQAHRPRRFATPTELARRGERTGSVHIGQKRSPSPLTDALDVFFVAGDDRPLELWAAGAQGDMTAQSADLDLAQAAEPAPGPDQSAGPTSEALVAQAQGLRALHVGLLALLPQAWLPSGCLRLDFGCSPSAARTLGALGAFRTVHVYRPDLATDSFELVLSRHGTLACGLELHASADSRPAIAEDLADRADAEDNYAAGTAPELPMSLLDRFFEGDDTALAVCAQPLPQEDGVDPHERLVLALVGAYRSGAEMAEDMISSALCGGAGPTRAPG